MQRVKVKALFSVILIQAKHRGCSLCAKCFTYIIVFNPLHRPLRNWPYFTDAETVYPFACHHRFCWQLFIKKGFQWSDLMLIYLHYPAISWVWIVHLVHCTLQSIKEVCHLLFFKCSWNDNLYLWVGKGGSVTYQNQNTESFVFKAEGVLGVKTMRTTTLDHLDIRL